MKTITLVCNPLIVFEEFDNEIILIDIEKGFYFTIGGLGVDLWKLFSSPYSPNHVFMLLTNANVAIDQETFFSFIDQLEENNLLIASCEESNLSSNIKPYLFSSVIPPTLSMYSDLAELIAIDPVHEVDKSLGWPVRQENFPKPV